MSTAATACGVAETAPGGSWQTKSEDSMHHYYTIWTDAESQQQIKAASLDEAVAIFSDDASITTWADLVAHVVNIGNGAWVRADSPTDPKCVALFESADSSPHA